MKKMLYKPLNFAVSALGGLVAGRVFKVVWQKIAGEGDAPNATDKHRTWQEILIAAAVQGAIFGAVKAAAERAGAVGYEKASGEWPGDD
ncbi:DUF4235 domain-containing protein [Amycolatopsis sp. FDAARGOS 1241]|uniref:DUF4235 domain-containing protein n=1 Tax=Amycolatopsis sp. FDAARGOS 1241 TaxID=2778070 RepID=UPI0019500CFB|nr:DUF4235 domain-containing protein [Amycolatopsis sp. FDAARGOS 1241]QRP50871.1 DUF4235 domain-containing protein [Amycolatopsis sp. FDAARGOS 1241]